ncbi:hypothetical protein GJ496_002180 [Pomphorhynchus laevis]|nr:hypothetical protein GJ496_002180 [Pomphorhynchus laevis]
MCTNVNVTERSNDLVKSAGKTCEAVDFQSNSGIDQRAVTINPRLIENLKLSNIYNELNHRILNRCIRNTCAYTQKMKTELRKLEQTTEDWLEYEKIRGITTRSAHTMKALVKGKLQKKFNDLLCKHQSIEKTDSRTDDTTNRCNAFPDDLVTTSQKHLLSLGPSFNPSSRPSMRGKRELQLYVGRLLVDDKRKCRAIYTVQEYKQEIAFTIVLEDF